MESYDDKDLPKLIDHITTHITTLLGPYENTPDKAQAVRKEFNDIKTIKEFFAILQDKYTSWFKHDSVLKIVNEIETEKFDLYKLAYIYKDHLHEYFRKCVTVADPASYGITDAPPGKQILIVKVDRGDYNQNDLYFLRKAIPQELDRPNLKVYLCQVHPN